MPDGGHNHLGFRKEPPKATASNGPNEAFHMPSPSHNMSVELVTVVTPLEQVRAQIRGTGIALPRAAHDNDGSFFCQWALWRPTRSCSRRCLFPTTKRGGTFGENITAGFLVLTYVNPPLYLSARIQISGPHRSHR